MDGKSKQEDIEARSLAYQRGAIALANSVRGFRELVGIDLTADIDTSGRRMGQEPYIKLTAGRLAELTEALNGSLWNTTVEKTVAAPAKVLQFSARRPGVTR